MWFEARVDLYAAKAKRKKKLRRRSGMTPCEAR